MTLCSVIMVSYHTGPILFGAIKVVLTQAQLAELIVIDNGNPPHVSAQLRALAMGNPRLKLVSGQGNIGFAKACNVGARQASGEFLMLLNPDCLLPPNALARFMEALDEVPGAVLAGAWLQNPDGSEQRGGRRQLLTTETALAEVLRLPGLKRHNNHGTPMPRGTHEVPVVSGACMCIRAADYARLSGFDEGYFLHVEDLDFCTRIHKMGGKVICVPDVQVVHILSTSGQTRESFIEWQKAKGFMRYFDKHLSEESIPRIVPLVRLAILVRFGLRVLRAQLRGKRQSGPAAKRLMLLASGLTDVHESSELDGKTVLVTGGNSQIGLCLLRRLIAANAAVLSVARGDLIPFRHANLRWIRGDLNDAALSLERSPVDYFVHCAPLTELPRALGRLADAAVGRVVAIASIEEEGANLEHLGGTIAERCRTHKIPWTVLRPTWVYGVGLDENVSRMARFIRRYGWFPVCPPAQGRSQPIHADDVARAVLQVLPCPASHDRIYRIGGESVTFREILERIFKLYGKPPRIVETKLLPLALNLAGASPLARHLDSALVRRMNDDLVFSYDDAVRDFGFTFRSFLSGGLRDFGIHNPVNESTPIDGGG